MYEEFSWSPVFDLRGYKFTYGAMVNCETRPKSFIIITMASIANSLATSVIKLLQMVNNNSVSLVINIGIDHLRTLSDQHYEITYYTIICFIMKHQSCLLKTASKKEHTRHQTWLWPTMRYSTSLSLVPDEQHKVTTIEIHDKPICFLNTNSSAFRQFSTTESSIE